MFLSEEEIEKRVRDSYELKNDVLKMTSKPLVSIRTSTYNHGPYIKQCIEGVLMQKTNFPFEYIIGEDFSTDETREIVFEYARKFPNVIRVITADYNVGSKANGRRCINACRGKYMAICEGDDYWIDPLKLQKQVDFLEKNPEYVMSHTSFRYYYELDKRFYNSKDVQVNPCYYLMLPEIILGDYRVQTVTVLLRANVMKKVQESDDFLFKSGYLMMGDTQLWYSMAQKGKIHFLPEQTAVYRVNQGSATRSNSIKNVYRFRLSSWEMRMYLCKRDNLSEAFKSRVYREYDRALVKYMCYDKNFSFLYPITDRKNVSRLLLMNKFGILKIWLDFLVKNRNFLGRMRRLLKENI